MCIESVLEQVKIKIEARVDWDEKYFKSRGNDNGFEELIPVVLDEIKKDGALSLDYTVHYGHHFPDIDVVIEGKKYGVELKSRNNESWVTNGNSVLESISTDGYEEIYVVFGARRRRLNSYSIMYKPYWEVATDISVTHSPRFKIDMNATKKVFTTKSSYDDFRKKDESEKIEFVQEYLRDNTDGDKWYIPQAQSIQFISINKLSPEHKKILIARALILFPKDLLTPSGGRTNYSNAAQYLLQQGYYSSSFRDLFSAGGKYCYKGQCFPQVINTLKQHSITINELLTSASEPFKKYAKKNWKAIVNISNSDNLCDIYTDLIDYIGRKYFSQELGVVGEGSLSKIVGLK